MVAAGMLAALVAAAADAPVKTSLLVVLKVLTYDAGFVARGKGDFVVLIPPAGDPARASALLEVARGSGVTRILERPLKFVLGSSDPLEAQAREAHASAILVPEGISGATAKEVARVGTALKIYTLAVEEAPVRQGLLLGVAVNDGKPQVVINITAARAQGVEFSASVLRIARTVQ